MGSSNTKVEGYCDPNYEKVKEHFHNKINYIHTKLEFTELDKTFECD